MLNAQTQVTGKVTDKKGHPVPGASITIKDSYDGATADSTGSFSFNTSEKGAHVLTVTNVGYNPVEQPVTFDGARLVLNILMKEQTDELKAVTITAGSFSARGFKTRRCTQFN